MQIAQFIAERLVFRPQKSFTRILIGIAITSVALSTSVMLGSMGVISGFKKTITEKIFGFWGHIHITDLHITRSYEAKPIEYDEQLVNAIQELTSADVREEGNQAPIINHVQSFVFVPGIIQTKAEIEGLVLKGIGDDFDFSILQSYMRSGDFPDTSSEEIGREILISQQTANRVGVDVGDKVILRFFRDDDQIKRAFKVCGIFRTGLEEYDVKFALVDIRNVQNILGWSPNQIAGYEIFTKETDDLPAIANHLYDNVIGNRLYCETIQEKFPTIFNWLDLQKINEKVIVGLMLLVCIINMATIVLIVILERSRMVGILKALGTQNKAIRGIFLRYSLWITGFGLLIGNILGLGFCFVQKYFPFITLDEKNYYVSEAPIYIQWWQVIGVNILTILLIFVCMLLPSLVASRITPIKVLKFD